MTALGDFPIVEDRRMAQLVRMRLSDTTTILVEVPDEEGIRRVGAAEGIVESIDKKFGELVESVITENCKLLGETFQRLTRHTAPPTKASAEFGLQVTADGNVYVVKSSVQASIKVSVQWQFGSH